MNLIDTNIKPDPFDPQRGDVYESGGPFPQRIVVEIPPRSEDQRIRYRVDGGADSNLTTLGQFHLHLAGLGEIRGVGRVREYSPITPDEIRMLVHGLRGTALGVDNVAGDLMRGAAATIVEQAAKLEEMHKRFSAHERALVTLGFPPGEDPEQWASRVHYEIVSNRKHDDQGYQAELNHRLKLQESLAEMRDGLLAAEQKIRKTPLAHNESTEPLAVARRIAEAISSTGELLVNTAWRFSTLIDAVVGSGTKDPRSDADLIRIATNARQVSDQVRSAVRLLGFEWDDSKADAGHALIEAVWAERKVASDLALELDSISAFIAPHGVTMPAGSDTKPTSLELVRWLAVTGGVVPHACHPTLSEVQEAQEVDFRARWDRYESAKRKPAINEPARPEFGEVDHFPSVAETRALGLRAEVHRSVAQLREISAANEWPIRERLQHAAAVMLEQAALRFADDNLRDRPPNERLTWVPRFNNGNGGASITLDGRTVFVSGTMARELSEALFRHQHVLAASKEERHNAILQRDDARSKLMAATEIIDFVWPRLEHVAGKSLERDLINAATLCTFLPGGRTEPSPNPIYCTGFVTILAVKDRHIVQRQSWTSDRPDFKPTDVSFHDDDPRFAAADALAFGDCQGTWTWQGRCYFADKPQWQGEWTEEKT